MSDSSQRNSAESVGASKNTTTTGNQAQSKESFEHRISQVFGHLKSAASTVNQLTSHTLSESQQSLMKQSIDNLFATMNEMRQKHGAVTSSNSEQPGSTAAQQGGFAAPPSFSLPSRDPNSTAAYEYSDIDDLELDMETLTDKYLENVDRFLEEHQSLKGNAAGDSKSIKPQNKWRSKPDNSNTVFEPRITEKPNAIVSLSETMSQPQGLDLSVESFPYTRHGFGLGGDVRRDSRQHPYLPELQALKFQDEQFKPCTPQMFQSMEEVPCTWIDNKSKLLELASLLDSQTEIAIDLEHHSYRTYQGFCCLMQISTRTEDFLVDTVELRDELHILNSSFTNPKIVKVMHGADCDILWLQRDFGLYIVNLFDTGQAARVLGLSPAYAYILPHYCEISPDKKYQLADWRVRPLPSVMINYARADTHFLLYIYDRLRNDIFDQKNGKEGLSSVLERSRTICMRRYEKFIYDETSYIYLRRKFSQGITEEEDAILRELFKWRDQIAREYDESVRFVLPDDTLIFVVTKKPLTASKLVQLCSPCSKLLKDNSEQVARIIQKVTRGEIADDSQQLPETPVKDALSGNNAGRDSPVLEFSQLCQQAHWFSKPEMVQSVSFDSVNPDDRMVDSTPNRNNVNVLQAKHSTFYNNSFQMRNAQNWRAHPQTPAQQDLMELCSPSSFAKPTPVSNYPVQPDQPQQQQQANPDSSAPAAAAAAGQEKFLDKHHFETPILTPPSSKNEDDRTPPEERVPKSLHEIFRLSQQNRRRNKQKKKLKQSSVTDPRPAYSPASKNSKEDVEDPKEFMDQIGWRVKSPTQELEGDNNGGSSKSSSGSGHGSSSHSHQQQHREHQHYYPPNSSSSSSGGGGGGGHHHKRGNQKRRNNRKKSRGRSK